MSCRASSATRIERPSHESQHCTGTSVPAASHARRARRALWRPNKL
ncbi:hypothetical protein BDSB_22900 [Burkholderia dolosa PC543]|nr:hypothetical protein BDSB_22900 [Burkholderia dolosa PC543]